MFPFFPVGNKLDSSGGSMFNISWTLEQRFYRCSNVATANIEHVYFLFTEFIQK